MLKIISSKLAQQNIDDFLAGNQPIRPPQPSNTTPGSRPDPRAQREKEENAAYDKAYYYISKTYPKLMEQMDQILEDTAAKRYGPGGVKWQQPQGEQIRGPRLQQAVSQFPGAENDPNVRYFIEQNLVSKLQGRD